MMKKKSKKLLLWLFVLTFVLTGIGVFKVVEGLVS